MNLDIASDESLKELYSFMQNREVPEFVKEAEVDTPESLAKLGMSAFADRGRRAFPINTPERTYLSNVYFLNKRAEIERRLGKEYTQHVEDTLQKSAELFEISEEVTKYKEATEALSAQDYPLRKIAVDWEDKELVLHSFNTADGFEDAAENFVQKIAEYPFEWRRTIAEQLIKHAQELGVDEVETIICKYAGLYFPHTPLIQQELWRRGQKLASESNRDRFNHLSKMAAELESKEDFFKLAEIVDQIEKNEGLYDSNKTAQFHPDTVDSFFTVSIEKAAEDTDFIQMGGEMFKTSDLKKVTKEAYEESFGFEVDPTNEEELRDVLPTIPRSDVGLFKQISGVSSF